MNNCVMGKLVIFLSAFVVLKHEFFNLHYLIIDMLIQIITGPESCLLGEIIAHLKLWSAQ